MMQRISQLAAVALLSPLALPLLFAAAACGDDAADDVSVDQLIAKLGSSEFAERENAARRLESEGLAIKDRLIAGANDPDLEVRLRCSEILARIKLSEIEQKLQAFIDDIEGKQEHDLPGWKRFRKVGGDDQAARKLFVEIFRQDREMLESMEWSAENREQKLLERIMASMSSVNRVGAGGLPHVSPASLAAALVVAAQDDLKPSLQCDIQLYSLLYRSQTVRLIDASDAREPMRRLLSSWVSNSVKQGSIPQYPLMVAFQYDLKESTLRLSREVLKAADNRAFRNSSTVPYLMLALGKYGGEEDVALVEKLLDNKTVFNTWNRQPMPPVRVQVRDVALAVLVHLTGQDRKDYGFDLLRDDSRMLYAVHTCGFVEDAKREAAMAKWREWSKARNEK